MTGDRTEGHTASSTRIRALACVLLVAVTVLGGAMMPSTAAAAAAGLKKAPTRKAPPTGRNQIVVLKAYVKDTSPRGVILRGPGRWDPRVDAPMGLVAYVDRGADPTRSEPGKVREQAVEDALDFEWSVSGPPGNPDAGKLERSDTGTGVPGWVFTAAKEGDYVIRVKWGPFNSSPMRVRVKLGKWKPIRAVVEKSISMRKNARVGDEYNLVAYLEYENVDPRFVDQQTRNADARYLTVKAAMNGTEIPGLVRYQSGTGLFGLKPGSNWWFKAKDPGEYEVWAEWRPPGGEGFDSVRIPMTVMSEFTGKYTGSIGYKVKPGRIPRLSKLDFTIDNKGYARGTFSYGDSEEFYNGTFDGPVVPVSEVFKFEDARLECPASMTRDLAQLPPYIEEWIRQAEAAERQLRDTARFVDDPAQAYNLQVIEAALQALRQLIEDSGASDKLQSGTIILRFGPMPLSAEGTLKTDANGELPMSARSFFE